MKTFEQLRRYIKENIPDPFKTKKGEGPDFEKNLKKATTKTYKQKGLDLYKAGGPYIPDKEVSQKTGKKVTQQIKKPYFGKPKLPQRTQKAPDRTGLKKAIDDVRASDKRLYDAGVGKKPSLVQQRKYTISRIKELSRQTTRQDAYDRAFGSGSGSTEGSAGASGSSKTVTPTKGVKQAEVSKKAKEFTKGIEQAKKAKTNKVVDLATKKQQSKLSQAAKNITQQRDDVIVKREKLRSVKGVKDTKAIRATNRQVKEFDKLAKLTQKSASGVGNPNAPVKYNKMTQGVDFIKKNRKSNTKLVTKSATKKPVSFKIKDATGTKNIKDVTLPKIVDKFRSGQAKYGANPIVKGLKQSKNPLAKQTYTTLKNLGPGGRALVKKGGLGGIAIAGLLSSPTVRKFTKGALTGAGIGFLAGNKKEEKPKAVLSPEVKIRTRRFSLSPGEKGGFTDVKYPKKS